jgi:hypothetical protein
MFFNTTGRSGRTISTRWQSSEALGTAPSGVATPCVGCDGYECDDGCAYPGVVLRAMQAPAPPHHLAKFGYRRPPHWLWRRSQRAFVMAAAAQDIWLIVTGRCSLHRAWQTGYDDGSLHEMTRQLNGGR